MLREEMSTEEEIAFVNSCFENYEKEGFSKVFLSPYTINSTTNRQGQPFKVLGKLQPSINGNSGEDTADLETLPMWKIQFEDGEVIHAYPEEIIPSEIKQHLTNESYKKYLS